jgi:hypothetical protein
MGVLEAHRSDPLWQVRENGSPVLGGQLCWEPRGDCGRINPHHGKHPLGPSPVAIGSESSCYRDRQLTGKRNRGAATQIAPAAHWLYRQRLVVVAVLVLDRRSPAIDTPHRARMRKPTIADCCAYFGAGSIFAKPLPAVPRPAYTKTLCFAFGTAEVTAGSCAQLHRSAELALRVDETARLTAARHLPIHLLIARALAGMGAGAALAHFESGRFNEHLWGALAADQIGPDAIPVVGPELPAGNAGQFLHRPAMFSRDAT